MKVKSGLVLAMFFALAGPGAAQQEFIYIPMSLWKPPGSSTTFAKVDVQFSGSRGKEALERLVSAYDDNWGGGSRHGIDVEERNGKVVVTRIHSSGTDINGDLWRHWCFSDDPNKPQLTALALDVADPGAADAAVVPPADDGGKGDPGAVAPPTQEVAVTPPEEGGGEEGGKGDDEGGKGDGPITHDEEDSEEDTQDAGTLFGENCPCDPPHDGASSPNDEGLCARHANGCDVDKGTCPCPPPHQGPYNPSDEGHCATHANGCEVAAAPGGKPGEPDPGPGKPGEPNPGPEPETPETRTLSTTTDWNVDYKITSGDSLGAIALELRQKLVDEGVKDPPDIWGDAGIVALLAQHNIEQNSPGLKSANAIYAGKTLSIPQCKDLFEEAQCQ